MKYVDAAITAEKISHELNVPMHELVDIFAEIPSADVQPVRHGRWIWDSNAPHREHGAYKCNNCGCHSDFEENYCPNCGADMRGENDE